MYEHACAGNLKEVRDMLNRGASVNFRDRHSGSTALIAASYEGCIEVVRALLKQEGVDVNIRDNDGETALIWASAKGTKGHLKVVTALLKHDGVDVNIQNIGGWTALIDASYYGHVEVVRALLKHIDVRVNIHDNDGSTALIYASYCGYLEVVRAFGHCAAI